MVQRGADAPGRPCWTRRGIDISRINDTPIRGHQGSGSVAEIAVRRLLELQGSFNPAEIVSSSSYPEQPTAVALPDHQGRIEITYAPAYSADTALAREVAAILHPRQWIRLIDRLGQIPELVVPTSRSSQAIRPCAREPAPR